MFENLSPEKETLHASFVFFLFQVQLGCILIFVLSPCLFGGDSGSSYRAFFSGVTGDHVMLAASNGSGQVAPRLDLPETPFDWFVFGLGHNP